MDRLPLGKRPATTDDRDITFAALRAAAGAAIPTPPANFGHGTIYHDGQDTAGSTARHWNMLGNGPDDTVEPGFQGAGDCAFAAAGHVVMEANRVAGRTVHVTGRNAIDDYSAVTGYRVGDDTTDVGTDMRDLMRYWRDVGIADSKGGRHKIAAYVSIAAGDVDELAQAAYVFSAVAIGFEFTQAQWDQFDQPDPVWDYVPGSRADGGHAIPVFGRRSRRAGAVSWGQHVWLTPEFYARQNDETWAFVFPDELRAGRNERGLDLAGLQSLLHALH